MLNFEFEKRRIEDVQERSRAGKCNLDCKTMSVVDIVVSVLNETEYKNNNPNTTYSEKKYTRRSF